MNIPGGADLTVGVHRTPAIATAAPIPFTSAPALTDKARALPLLRTLTRSELLALADWCREEADTRT
ncbi:hypothetical protein SAM9427_37020 (plasmid) [Streptomyces sp. ETH9427]|uniref:hypothetical protein n=1 Tax=Streptomyces sp. E1N211 TaxID=1851876 RepID=UPI000E0A7A8F|nr:hypothetical protein [Streptomyces sp. E1N211]AXI91371.1 hypothetical protein SAM9427_37020 [Streptomyces sp. ETH9427]